MNKLRFIVNTYHDYQIVGPDAPAKTDVAEANDELTEIFLETKVAVRVDDEEKPSRRRKTKAPVENE